jgi:hypothetical protein
MFKLVYPRESPCGCGSGREFGKCCLKNGNIKLTPKKLTPPRPQTRKSHPKCLLNCTNDCSDKISGDHIVSQAVLKVINKKEIFISTSKFSRKHSLSSLITNRLCTRHNSALSPIDSEAARLFRAFTAIHESLSGEKECQKLFLFHGEDLERWMLKTMLMVYSARLTDVNADNFTLPIGVANLFDCTWPSPLGFYVPTKKSDATMASFQKENSATVSIVTKGHIVAGATITLGGLEFMLVVHGECSDFVGLQQSHTYRPKNLIFFKEKDVYAIMFAHACGSSQDIWFSHGDAKASNPEN